MTDMVHSKRAVVLAGGGSLGSYELGAWKALRETGFQADMAAGASIGSINAALYAQDDFALAEHLWDNIRVEQVMESGVNLDFHPENLLAQRDELRAFLLKYAQSRGADISPLVALLKNVINEERVRASCIDMGLVTIRFPSLTPLEMWRADIPRGQLVDYLLASCALFPAFPMWKIGTETFVDGGYYDNLPIRMAIAQGAEEIVAVDLRPRNRPVAQRYAAMPHITYIAPLTSMGSVLNFDPEVVQRNKRQGYADACLALGRARGFVYSFRAKGLAGRTQEGLRFSALISRLQQSDARLFPAWDTRMPLSELIRQHVGSQNLDAVDFLLRGAEVSASLFHLPRDRVYPLPEMLQELIGQLPLEQAKTLYPTLGAQGAEHLLAARTHIDPGMTVALLALLLTDTGRLAPALAAALPQETITACLLSTARETRPLLTYSL